LSDEEPLAKSERYRNFMSNFYHRIKHHVHLELASARWAESNGEARLAFSYLERAHILGQRSTRLHVLTHWRMMGWAMRQRQCSEVFGQLWRIVGATLSTAIGLVPDGNTGGTNVSGFRKMPVPEELRAIIDTARARFLP
jgi:Protein of unknown function (DUF3703)